MRKTIGVMGYAFGHINKDYADSIATLLANNIKGMKVFVDPRTLPIHIQTDKVHIFVFNWSNVPAYRNDKLRGYRFDECFGFDDNDALYLTGGRSVGKYRSELENYLLELHKKEDRKMVDNYTYFKDEIEKIVRSGHSVAVDKKTGEPKPCQEFPCYKCEFSGQYCEVDRKNWLNAEHKEQPTISRIEREFLELIGYDCWMARDKDEYLYIYAEKPHKTILAWCGYDMSKSAVSRVSSKIYHGVNFDFIKWEDEEPWAVKDLMKLEIK